MGGRKFGKINRISRRGKATYQNIYHICIFTRLQSSFVVRLRTEKMFWRRRWRSGVVLCQNQYLLWNLSASLNTNIWNWWGRRRHDSTLQNKQTSICPRECRKTFHRFFVAELRWMIWKNCEWPEWLNNKQIENSRELESLVTLTTIVNSRHH